MLAFVADTLTFSRLVAAAVLVWLGSTGALLREAVLVVVLAWTTDMLDGWAARHASKPTRLAPYDFAIDTTLYAGTLAYLTMAGFLPAWPVLAFVAMALLAWLIVRRKAVQILTVRLIDVAAAVVIFTHEPVIGWLLVLWLAVMALVYRRRLAKRVPRWLAELARIFGLTSET
jgi:phosphatidylglycerophosphate synthase